MTSPHLLLRAPYLSSTSARAACLISDLPSPITNLNTPKPLLQPGQILPLQSPRRPFLTCGQLAKRLLGRIRHHARRILAHLLEDRHQRGRRLPPRDGALDGLQHVPAEIRLNLRLQGAAAVRCVGVAGNEVEVQEEEEGGEAVDDVAREVCAPLEGVVLVVEVDDDNKFCEGADPEESGDGKGELGYEAGGVLLLLAALGLVLVILLLFAHE
jgi:hypothetical protein